MGQLDSRIRRLEALQGSAGDEQEPSDEEALAALLANANDPAWRFTAWKETVFLLKQRHCQAINPPVWDSYRLTAEQLDQAAVLADVFGPERERASWESSPCLPWAEGGRCRSCDAVKTGRLDADAWWALGGGDIDRYIEPVEDLA